MCLGEGFCPSCRQPLGYAITLAPGVSWGQCWPCGCSWEYDRVAYSHVIRWRGEVNGFQWDIVTLDNDDVRGAAEWAE